MTKDEAICKLYGLIADINEEEVADHIKSGVSLQDWANAWRCRAKDVLRVLEDTADIPQTDCKKFKHFATDKCRECYGNEYFEDSGYTTEMANTSQTLDLGNGFSITANITDTSQTERNGGMKESDRFLTDDITWCIAECSTDCPRQPKYIRDKSIPHSFADFSKECMAYMWKGAEDE